MSNKDIYITIPKDEYDKLLNFKNAILEKKHLWVHMAMYGGEYIQLVTESEAIERLQKRINELEPIGIIQDKKKGVLGKNIIALMIP